MESTSPNLSGWRHFAWYHSPVILYAAIIIGVSSVPYLRTPQLQVIAFDKLAHLCEYAVFAFLVFRSFTHMPKALNPQYAFLFAAAFVAAFAVFDEFCQQFVPGRFSSGLDIMADLAGGLLVLAFFELRRRRRG
ncbi:MAG: VanZ family protein [bacterium]